MSPTGPIEAIHIAPEAASTVEPRQLTVAIGGRCRYGYRYYRNDGTCNGVGGDSRRPTVIEGESITATARSARSMLESGKPQEPHYEGHRAQPAGRQSLRRE